MLIYFTAFLCVCGIAAGQILFKLGATAINETGTIFNIKPFLILFSAMVLYGLTSIVWIMVLQKAELGKIYPLMALAFIFVPFGSHLAFGETFNFLYYLGTCFIIIGIIFTIRS